MPLSPSHGDGLLSRADLEIELARLALITARKRESGESDRRLVAWFEEVSVDLINRVAPELRPLAIERIQQIAEFNGRMEITRLSIDATTLGFGMTYLPSRGVNGNC